MIRSIKLALFLLFGAATFLLAFHYKISAVPAANYSDRDDAVITLSHARNLVEYGFIGVAPSGERIEGFSAPLQFWIAAAAYEVTGGYHYSTFLHWQTLLGTLLLGALVAALLISPASRGQWQTRDLFTVVAIGAAAWILASSRAFLLWHESGMENIYKSVGLVAVLLVLDTMLHTQRVRPLFAGVVFLATLTRIDAILPVFILLAAFAVLWSYRFRNADAVRFLALSLMPWLLFMIWRRLYFGQWMPNTALAQGISVSDRLGLLLHTPGRALGEYWQWLETGKSLHVFQFGWLLLLPLLVRRNGLASGRAGLLLAGASGCLAQYICFGPARMDPARTVTEWAIYSVLVVPFVLGGLTDIRVRELAAGVVMLGISVAAVSSTPPDRNEIGWGTASFEPIADEVQALARLHDIPRPLLANPDLGAISWRKEANIIDLGRLGSATIPRLTGVGRYLAEFEKPDVIEIHGAWSCTYQDLFVNRTFIDEYLPVRASDSNWVAAHCPGAQGAKDGLWIRRAVLKDSRSTERSFLERFRAHPDTGTVSAELQQCAGNREPNPCAYVGRTLFRFVPEMKRAGTYEESANLLANNPAMTSAWARLTSSQHPGWWRDVLARVEPLVLTPQVLSVFARLDGIRGSDGRVTLHDAPEMRWHAGAPTPPLLEVRPDSGPGDAVINLVPLETTSAGDAMVEIPFYLDGIADPRATLRVRVRSLMPSPSARPFGAVDAPPDPITLGNATINFQGWALDEVALQRVRVAYHDGARGQETTLGETRGIWSRPDVARLFPDAHDIYNSGWVFPLDPAVLSRVPRPVTLNFYAESNDGRSQLIGSRTIK